jgi:uncharacterized protein (DUF885 family)
MGGRRLNAELADLAARYWEAKLRASPTAATMLGIHDRDDEIEDLSRAAEDPRIAELDAFAAAAFAVDPSQLTEDERVSREVLAYEASTGAAELRSRMAELNVNGFSGPHLDYAQIAGQIPIVEPAHADALVARWSRLGLLFDQAIGRLRQGVARERTPTVRGCEVALRQIDTHLASDIGSDPLVVSPQPPESFDEAAVAEWRQRLSDVVRDTVRPAVALYRAAIADEVLPKARPEERSGICWIGDGEEVYARAILRHTSLQTTPMGVHATGRTGIIGLEGEYSALGASVLGITDIAAIYERLRNDVTLRFDSPEEIVAAARAALERAQAAVPEWFGIYPATPCVVAEMPATGAEDSTIAYYLQPAADGSRPGTYFVNTTQPATRTRFEAEVLAFHESVPGHHLQLALNQELDMPEFRRHAFVTVFHEGWGLYTERLSDEMGLYSGDVERLGMLSFDSWRACRLVVDTGMHALGWSRQDAIDYMTTNSPQATNNIGNEVDRYIAWPGQAIAYKTGQLAMIGERALAEKALGDRFDIRGFHDVLLGAGSVPLPVMQRRVRQWAAG